MNIRYPRAIILLAAMYSLIGCHQAVLRDSDRSVYDLIVDRQQAALGTASDVFIGDESDEIEAGSQAYRFNPQPLESQVPAAFAHQPSAHDQEESDIASDEADETDIEDKQTAELSRSIFSESQAKDVITFSLRDALAYAMRHGRDLQNAKEDLYLAALDLTLERHLWTPLFVSNIQAEFSDFGQITDFDQALNAVSDFSVSQRLPQGGQVTARLINTLVRDLSDRVTTGESGRFILDANIPLFRGAGKIAYETRYVAERNLIYAARTFERFRRTFLVNVASNYFDLQQRKAAIDNTFHSYQSRKQDWERADFIDRMGKSRNVFDAPRAKSNVRQSEASLVSAKERYETTLDQFKIFIGMEVERMLEVVGQDEDTDSKAMDDLLPDIELKTAVKASVHYRLDLLNVGDRVGDAKRGIVNAKNRILPDLDLTGSVTLDSNPDEKNSNGFNTDRATWRSMLSFRMDDRQTERNAYRASIINLRRADRAFEEFTDRVRADVRRALRRIDQQESLRTIQSLNLKENAIRLDAAKAQFSLGKSTNQDVVDAENELLAAQNNFARAISDYRVAILQFRRDTGTLRITNDGRWDPSLSAKNEDQSQKTSPTPNPPTPDGTN